jgi:hypothetical protein
VVLVAAFVATRQLIGVVSAAPLSVTNWIWGGGGKQNATDTTSNTNVGWFHMNGTATNGTAYGVTIDNVTNQLDGYAWSENVGALSFKASDLSGCPSGTCTAVKNSTTNKLTGWARLIEIKNAAAISNAGGWLGWVRLSGTAQDGSAYGVVILSDGTVDPNNKYAWSDELGWIDFSKAKFPPSGPVNQPPTVTVSFVGNCVNSPVGLNAVASDPENNIPLTYAWSFVSGPVASVVITSGNTANATFTPTVTGNYTFKVVVTDSLGAFTESLLTVNVIICPGNQPPTVNPTAVTACPGNVAFLSCGALDPEGNPMTYLWTQVGSSPQSVTINNNTQCNANFLGNISGSPYTFNVRVTDTVGGAVVNGQVSVTLTNPACDPVWQANHCTNESYVNSCGITCNGNQCCCDPTENALHCTGNYTNSCGSTCPGTKNCSNNPINYHQVTP